MERLEAKPGRRSTRDRHQVAPPGLSALLAMEIPWSPAEHSLRNPTSHPRDGWIESDLGCPSHSRRAPEARLRSVRTNSLAISCPHPPQAREARISELGLLPPQPGSVPFVLGQGYPCTSTSRAARHGQGRGPSPAGRLASPLHPPRRLSEEPANPNSAPSQGQRSLLGPASRCRCRLTEQRSPKGTWTRTIAHLRLHPASRLRRTSVGVAVLANHRRDFSIRIPSRALAFVLHV